MRVWRGHRENRKDKSDDALGLAAFRQVPAGGGLPLDQLSSALGGLLESGDDPYSTPRASAAEAVDTVVAEPEEESCEITPRTILEAMLFVDGPRNEPLSSKHVASLMRGVRPAEIDALVQQLNADYARRRCPYTIVTVGAGYRLVLHPRYERLRDKVLGRSRRARLSQAAIEVLAAVAYHEPITADEISRMRGTPSGHVLAPPGTATIVAAGARQRAAAAQRVLYHAAVLGPVRIGQSRRAAAQLGPGKRVVCRAPTRRSVESRRTPEWR